MEYLLNKAKLLWVIDEVTECPDDVKESPDFKRLFRLIMKSGNPDFKLFQMKWKRDNQSAIRVLKVHCDPTHAEQVEIMKREGKTAFQIWDEFEKNYNWTDPTQQSSNWEKLISLKVPADATPAESKKLTDEFLQLQHKLTATKIDFA